jgi:predicted nucleic acid-binding protein
MKLLINDANILIDIFQCGLTDAFLSLNFELKTTDFVFSELEPEQQKKMSSHKLQIIETNDLADFTAINNLKEENKGVSFEDCSVWYYAKKLNGVMVTGDGNLRKKVTNSGLEVRGIIYLIEEMKQQKLLTTRKAIDKLKELKMVNSRLPVNEIDRRINAWEQE